MKEKKRKREDSPISLWDLYAAFTLVLLSALSISFEPLDVMPVRTVLGLVLTLFLPGYSLVAALFPKKAGLGLLERIALSFGLSIAIAPLLGLILNYTPYGIAKDSVLFALCAFSVICLIIAYARRKSLKADEAFSISLQYDSALPENRLDKALTVLLMCSIVVSLAVLVYVIVSPKQGEKFTEFYILGAGGKAENYPTNLKVGGNGTVLIGVVNHEYEEVNYTLRILLGNESLRSQRIALENNQSYSAEFSFSPVRNGTEKLSFQLYRNESDEPYRSLHLWVKTE